MKREDLIEYKADENFGNGLVYSILEVNQVLDENDAEIAELKQKLEDVNELIKTARQMLEDAKASHYAEMVDAGMRERRLERALLLVCARLGKMGYLAFHNIESKLKGVFSDYEVADRAHKKKEQWRNVERKCLKKAEEYK